MTLDEAIIHAEEIAERCAVTDGDKTCEQEHRQLAEWLNELKKLREKANHSDASNSSELTTKQAAIDAIYDTFCYAYCDNCENSTKDDDSCEDCHRKYQNWRASKDVIEKVINGLPSVQLETKQQAIKTSDSISRHAAITTSLEFIVEYLGGAFDEDFQKELKKRLEALPSAEPEIIRCKDCKHRDEDECPMRYVEWVTYEEDGYFESDDVVHDRTLDDGFCDRWEKDDTDE